MKLILERLGVGIQFKSENTYVFDTKNLISNTPDMDLCRKIEIFLMASPLLYRFGETRLPVPGGDIIGRRRLDTHFKVLTELGATIEQEADTFIFGVTMDSKAPICFWMKPV
jgi:UDP-N-acetylglucosamine enolpyruvyl transferase